jgi:anti-sigma-K factor RskA
MSGIDDLAPDQRAVLQLLLKQGKAYIELAALLRIEPDAVRDRAITALNELGPREGVQLAPERRAEIGDYLLGQQSASERQATREFLESSGAGRAWARTVAGELRPLAGEALPEIPAEGAEAEEAFGAPPAREARRTEVAERSRKGGAILLVGAAVVAIALILIIRSGGSDDNGDSSKATPSTSTSTTAGQPSIDRQINLKPRTGSASKALGVLLFLSQGTTKLIAVRAENLRPTTDHRFYAVWLTGDNVKPRALGFAPAVPPSGQNKGRLAFLNAVPSGASSYNRFVISVESKRSPTKPGTTVLQGPWTPPA